MGVSDTQLHTVSGREIVSNEGHGYLPTKFNSKSYRLHECISRAVIAYRSGIEPNEGSPEDTKSNVASEPLERGIPRTAASFSNHSKADGTSSLQRRNRPGTRKSLTSSCSRTSEDVLQAPLLLDFCRRNLRNLNSLHASVKADALRWGQHDSGGKAQTSISDLVGEALSSDKSRSQLKRWVDMQQRFYEKGYLCKQEEEDLRMAGIHLLSRSQTAPAADNAAFSVPIDRDPACRTGDNKNYRPTATPPSSSPSSWQPRPPLPAHSAILVVKEQDGTIADKFVVSPQVLPDHMKQEYLLESAEKSLVAANNESLPKKRKRLDKDGNDEEPQTPISMKKTAPSVPPFGKGVSTVGDYHHRATNKKSKVEVGSTLWIYYYDEDFWYKSIILRVMKSKKKAVIGYVEGSQKDKIDLQEETWMIDEDSSCNPNKQKEASVRSLSHQSKLEIWWPNERKYFPGVLAKISSSSVGKKGPHFMVYDDGDEEWTNLNERRFHKLG